MPSYLQTRSMSVIAGHFQTRQGTQVTGVFYGLPHKKLACQAEAVSRAMTGAGLVRSGRTRSAPALRSSAADARPLATATDSASPIFAASTSRGESAT